MNLIIVVLYLTDLPGSSDIVFAIDTTVATEAFSHVKMFVNAAIRPLDTENGNARIGLLQYAMKPSKLMDFTDSSKSKMGLLLATLRQQNEDSDPVSALKFIENSFYGKQMSRQDAEKTIVLLINGDRAQIDGKALNHTLNTLNSLGIKYVLIAIGGPRSMQRELKEKGDDHGIVHLLDSSSQLPTVIPNVVKPGKGEITV